MIPHPCLRHFKGFHFSITHSSDRDEPTARDTAGARADLAVRRRSPALLPKWSQKGSGGGNPGLLPRRSRLSLRCPHPSILVSPTKDAHFHRSRNASAQPIAKVLCTPLLMASPPLTVAWISDFPVEWLPDVPGELRSLPRPHPMTWMTVLLSEFEKNPSLRLQVIALRKAIDRDFSFERIGVVFHLLKV